NMPLLSTVFGSHGTTINLNFASPDCRAILGSRHRVELSNPDTPVVSATSRTPEYPVPTCTFGGCACGRRYKGYTCVSAMAGSSLVCHDAWLSLIPESSCTRRLGRKFLRQSKAVKARAHQKPVKAVPVTGFRGQTCHHGTDEIRQTLGFLWI